MWHFQFSAWELCTKPYMMKWNPISETGIVSFSPIHDELIILVACKRTLKCTSAMQVFTLNNTSKKIKECNMGDHNKTWIPPYHTFMLDEAWLWEAGQQNDPL